MITKFIFSNPESMINVLKRNKVDFLVRQTTESTHIIYSNRKFIYKHSSNFPAKFLFLFKIVENEAKKWAETNVPIAPDAPSSHFNLEYDDNKGKIVGVDLNHAYWRIAFNKGIISEKTYERGLDDKCKALRLAALSVLGKERRYTKYKNGKEVIGEGELVKEADPKLDSLYMYIRQSCYAIMQRLSEILGEDFDCWKTDAIYFRDTPENRKIVTDFITERNITYKILDYYEGENDEEE